jgi:hypothetical protein
MPIWSISFEMRKILSFLILLFCPSFLLWAKVQRATILYENDSIYRHDRYYTSGVGADFTTDDHYTFGLGQKIFTPRDINIDTLLTDDRPYAGYLYFFVSKDTQEEKLFQTYRLALGATGKPSLGELAQKEIHAAIGSPEPMGWKYQTANEFLAMISWAGGYEIYHSKNEHTNWNFIPKVEVNIGTPITSIAPAVEWRVGTNIYDDLKKKGYYFFLGAKQNIIAHNTFLDGNLFEEDKVNIKKETLTHEVMTGISLNFRSFYLKFTHIYLGKEFQQQKYKQQNIFSLRLGMLF